LDNLFKLSILIFVSYFLGAIPTGFLVGKIFFKKDIRLEGSKNTGATNVFRVFGALPGIAVLIIDILKGFLPVFFIPEMLFPGALGSTPVLAGLACVAGHNWTVFLDFKGGKGVATSLGVFLALAPIQTILSAIVFSIVLGLTGYVSLGSIIAGVSLAVFLWVSPFFPLAKSFGLDFTRILDVVLSIKIIGTIISLLVFYTHRSNIKRLLDGKENRLWRKK